MRFLVYNVYMQILNWIAPNWYRFFMNENYNLHLGILTTFIIHTKLMSPLLNRGEKNTRLSENHGDFQSLRKYLILYDFGEKSNMH